MPTKAIDIVLLCDERMASVAIGANAELVRSCNSEIVLNSRTCLPHISLAMGCVDTALLGQLESIIRDIAEHSDIGELTVAGVEVTSNRKGEKVSSFSIEKNPALQGLHEKVMNRSAGLLHRDVEKSMLFGNEPIADSTLNWITNYRVNSSFENFNPHITIGYGETPNISRPIRFKPMKLAICHLGNHCTCRDILAAADIPRQA